MITAVHTAHRLGPARLPLAANWSPNGSNGLKTGEFVRIPEKTQISGYTTKGGIATAYRGVEIFLEGNRSPAMEKKLKVVQARIDHTLPEGRPLVDRLAYLQGANPDDAYWEKKYKSPGFSSLATARNGKINFWGGETGRQGDFDHELGHAITKSGLPPAPRAWDRAMEMDRRNVAKLLTRAHIFPAEARIAMISGANRDGISTYAQKALEAGSPAEDWAESISWYNRSQRLGWVAKVGSGEEGARARKVTFDQMFPERAKLIERYLEQTGRTGRRA